MRQISGASAVVAACLLLGSPAVFAVADTPFAAAPAPIVLTVTSTGDEPDGAPGDGACGTAGGGCTLRAAIEELNASDVPARVSFSIAGDGIQTIFVDSPLPPIEQRVTIDGYTQPGSAPATATTPASLRIAINGMRPLTNTPWTGDGLVVGPEAGHSVIRGLAVGGFRGFPIRLYSDGNRVSGNFVGVDPGGDSFGPASYGGIRIEGASQNVVGGDSDADRNVIGASSLGSGVSDRGGRDNRIVGNFVGLAPEGDTVEALANSVGIGLTDATNDRVDRNVIVFSQTDGVRITGGSGHTMRGNVIGLDAAGEHDLGNSGGGVKVVDSDGNQIGGPDPGDRNVISSNWIAGVWITGAESERNRLLGNFIGTDASGLSATDDDGFLGNRGPGVWIDGAQRSVLGTARAGNVISGNGWREFGDGSGIRITGATADATAIEGNVIGLDRTGGEARADGSYAHLGNANRSIQIVGAPRTRIGGAAPGAGNVIADTSLLEFNGDRPFVARPAIDISEPEAVGTRILGNLIGTDRTGTESRHNGNAAIAIHNAPGTVIGGTDRGARNVIADRGLEVDDPAPVVLIGLDGPQTTGTRIAGNFLGTDITGTKDMGPPICDVIVGPDVTATSIVRNVIVNGHSSGIETHGAETRIAGNFVGLAADGRTAMPNKIGLRVLGGAGTTIDDNVISGNSGHGLEVNGSATAVRIEGNFVGTDVSGRHAVGNAADGISVRGGSDIVIGDANLISGNDGIGVGIQEISGVRVLGNRIGTDVNGRRPLGNGDWGVVLAREAVGATVGRVGAGNVIAHNADGGVLVSPQAFDNAIRGNAIFGNGGLPIDLWVASAGDPMLGPTPNDPLDDDDGANRLQNFPVLDATRRDRGWAAVAGVLNSSPNAQFWIDVYGRGGALYTSASVTTDADGTASFAEEVRVPDGEILTATATDSAGNTSEMSPGVTPLPDTTILAGPEAQTTATSAVFEFTASESGSTFVCRLDAAEFAPCTSPTAYDGLTLGAHTFEVKATDAAGNVDATPAVRTFTVVAPAGGGGGGAGQPGTSQPGPITRPPTVTPDTTGPAIVVATKKTLRASKSGVVRFAIGPMAENATGVLSLQTDRKVRAGGRRRILSFGSKAVNALTGQRVSVKVKLGKTARRLLARRRSVRIHATLTLSDSAGNATVKTFRFTLKAPRRG